MKTLYLILSFLYVLYFIFYFIFDSDHYSWCHNFQIIVKVTRTPKEHLNILNIKYYLAVIILYFGSKRANVCIFFLWQIMLYVINCHITPYSLSLLGNRHLPLCDPTYKIMFRNFRNIDHYTSFTWQTTTSGIGQRRSCGEGGWKGLPLQDFQNPLPFLPEF